MVGDRIGRATPQGRSPRRQRSPEGVAGRGRSAAVGLGRRLKRAGRSYTLFVIFSKWLLPLAACAIVTAVVVWPQLNTPEGFTVEAIDPSLLDSTEQMMLGPVLKGVDESRQPYRIESTAAAQSKAVEGGVELDRPEADLQMADGSMLYLQSDVGLYDQRGDRLELFGGVSLFHQGEDGHVLETDMTLVDLAARLAETDAPVQGHGPVGLLQAENGFRVTDGGARIVFRGPARLILKDTGRQVTGSR